MLGIKNKCFQLTGMLTLELSLPHFLTRSSIEKSNNLSITIVIKFENKVCCSSHWNISIRLACLNA